jgi:glutathione-regulated potassium-efflux system ancillary protein KefF
MIAVIHAHPYPHSARATAALIAALEGLPDVHIRSLYDLYPDFDIDPAAERKALEPARLVIFLHPLYWYTVPAALKHWFDVVLVKGWAYGEGGTGLKGKDCLWVITTGGDEEAFTAEGRHGHPMAAFAPVVEQTMRFCGMNWLEPLVVHGAHIVPPEVLEQSAQALRARVESWRLQQGAAAR